MAKKHGPEADKTWVHLDEDAHLFDQTNGLVEADDEPPRAEGLSDEERIARAGIITNAASGVGGF